MSTSSPSSKTLAGDASHSPAATWTESDELGLLRAVLEIALEPAEAFDPRISLFTRINRNLGGKKFTSSDILAKVKELRRKYENGGAAGGEAFDISHRIWGLEEEIERQLTKQLENMDISKDTSTLPPKTENKHDEQSTPLTSPRTQTTKVNTMTFRANNSYGKISSPNLVVINSHHSRLSRKSQTVLRHDANLKMIVFKKILILT